MSPATARHGRLPAARAVALVVALALVLAVVLTGGLLLANRWLGSPGAGDHGRAAPPTGWFARGVGEAADRLVAVATTAQVQALLDARSTAVRDADRAGFLAGVEPRSRSEQQDTYRRLAAVPFQRYQVRLADRAEITAADAADGRLRLPVVVDSRLRGDAGRSVAPARAGFRLGESGWRLTDLRPRRPELWDLTAVDVVAGRGGLVVAAAGADSTGLAADLDAAVAAVDDAWPMRWPGRVVLELPADAEQLQALVDRPGAGGLAAVTTLYDGGHGPVVRVRLNPEVNRTLVPLARQILLRHEITHAAQYARPYEHVPAWLVEGSAELVGYAGSGVPDTVVAATLLAEVRAGRMPQRLPGQARFGFTRDATARRLAYEMAWSACRSIADRYGERAVFAVYRQLLGPGGSAAAPERAAVRAALGVPYRAFVAQWQDWLRSRA